MATGTRPNQAAAPAPGPGAPPRRADARRNVAAILTAAAACLAENPDTSMAEIAAAAGVGRMTLYGHFKTRADLLDAVLARLVAEAHAALDAVDLAGDPRAALARLVTATWLIVDQLRQVMAAAQRELPAERLRQAHELVLGRVQALIERGQDAGQFRADLPLAWLVSLAMSVMHAAAAEVTAGRLSADQAPAVVAGTLLAALTAPGAVVPLPPGGKPVSPNEGRRHSRPPALQGRPIAASRQGGTAFLVYERVISRPAAGAAFPGPDLG